MPPTSMQALIIGKVLYQATLDTTHTVPKPSVGQILVKVVYAAQNAPDAYGLDPALSAAYREEENVLGTDFAGTVIESHSPLVPVGSRVCGWVAGNATTIGSFAEYLVTDADMVIKVPDSMSLDEASTVGLSFMTAVHALSSCLGLPLEPRDDNHVQEPKPVLVWGGNTACGNFAIQLLKNAGYQVITTASENARQKLQKLGADTVLPRNDPEKIASEVRALFPHLAHALDCFASSESAMACAHALGEKGGHVHTLLPIEQDIPNVRTTFALVHSTLGRPMSVFDFAGDKPTASQLKADRLLATEWCSYDKGYAYKLLREGRLLPTNIVKWDGGLPAVQSGIEALLRGDIAGAKIVHSICQQEA
ncbi:chaperonin 10-like protein [Umbelopsis sp. AD052]|nr:chaperonin 10-like protein [Umbelopsis sp. AD052]